MPSISIIVPTCNRGELLRDCLEALAIQSGVSDRPEIIVVNDGGVTPNWLDSQFPLPVSYIEQPNRGPAAARNTGAKNSSGDILVFLDDDCVPRSDWLASLLSVYEKHPDAGGVSGTLTNGDKSTAVDHWEVREFIPLFNKLNAALGTSFTEEGRVWFHFGCNASYRREVFFGLHGFDESLRMMEDTDFHWRLHEKGVPVYYSPTAIVEHNGQKHFMGELRRCFRGGIAYRNYCRLHPGYRELIAESSTGKSSIVKSVVSAVSRASTYSTNPRVKLFFMLTALMHKFMYALGYLSRKSPAEAAVVEYAEPDHTAVEW